MLTLADVAQILEAKIVCCHDDLEKIDILAACGADLLSDVLAFTKERTLLLTGMTNMQVIRTVEIGDLSAIVFVRGKIPREDIVEAAQEHKIPILSTEYTMYEACGKLYGKGLPACARIKGAIEHA